ncbi:DNA replication and repair protein RadC [Granulicatella balaenopterae]|uniref:DNA replication and repair protein RadC n=1 Tax=Granulicatella balaenopterae TaxID=137733 RepID=A0A1H9KMQ5_9LACT|nr:DNA repair protein RadC [Granulicatella balaenopterae]SER00430.1 DNA replication and repair protein RadC [Granulicatella balaenopterae]
MKLKNSIMEVPVTMLPRERLEKYGEKQLATHELLAIILRTGTKDHSVLELALDILATFEDLYGLKMASLDELMTVKGIGRAKAIELRAAIELGIRIAISQATKESAIISSEVAGKIFQYELCDAYQEHLLVLFLNTKNEIIKKRTVFKGGLNSAVAHPREIFREAVKCSAAKMILGHNHPSGNLEPSNADINFTKRMVECGELMGIEVLDHIIVSSNHYLSLKEKGYF